MRVALLVFPIHYSHGCILQTYALYSKLTNLGHAVTIIDRQPVQMTFFQWVITILKRLVRKIFKGYNGAVFYKGWYPKQIMEKQMRFVDTFAKDIITVYSTEELKKTVNSRNFDSIIVGSDQTWRPCNVPNVMDYWLEFAKDDDLIKISYAPSFGVDVWEYPVYLTDRCKKLAVLFRCLSVREKSGIKLCKEYLGQTVTHVLDPTMLWDKSFYIHIAEKCNVINNGCQCYFLDRNPNKVSIANKVASILNLRLNFVNTETENEEATIKERIAPSIEEWLAGFYNGDFIVVDSFHAMVFSIIFQKPFVVIGNVNRGLSRFESLLSELGLEKRLLTDANDLNSIISENIDWDIVNIRLSVCRKKSMHYLEQALI